MPGPVSDSYDPEFGTGARAAEVMEAIGRVRERVTNMINSDELKDIVRLSEGYNANESVEFFQKACSFSERELRIIRFCLNRALETI